MNQIWLYTLYIAHIGYKYGIRETHLITKNVNLTKLVDCANEFKVRWHVPATCNISRETGLITDIVSDVAPATGKVDTYNCHFHRRQNKNGIEKDTCI